MIREICRSFGMSDQSCHRWQHEHGGMDVSQALQLTKLKRENARLREAVCDLTPDKLIVDEALTGKF